MYKSIRHYSYVRIHKAMGVTNPKPEHSRLIDNHKPHHNALTANAAITVILPPAPAQHSAINAVLNNPVLPVVTAPGRHKKI